MFDSSTTFPAGTTKPKRVRKPRTPKPVVEPVAIIAPEPLPILPSPVEAKPEPKPVDKTLTHYAVAGIAVMATLSAGLNGYANAQHSPVAWAGWGMGLAIPGVILLLGKVAGILYQRGFKPLAYVTAASGIGLLALSVWHCAVSISMITGSDLLLAVPMAIAIDVGFVCCELAVLTDKERVG